MPNWNLHSSIPSPTVPAGYVLVDTAISDVLPVAYVEAYSNGDMVLIREFRRDAGGFWQLFYEETLVIPSATLVLAAICTRNASLMLTFWDAGAGRSHVHEYRREI